MVRVDAGSGGGLSIVILVSAHAVAAGSTIVSGEATCVVTTTGANVHVVTDDDGARMTSPVVNRVTARDAKNRMGLYFYVNSQYP